MVEIPDKDIQDFKRNFKDSLFFAREYGLFTTALTLPNKANYSYEDGGVLISNVHTGFKKAQLLIIDQILEIQDKTTIIKDQLKAARVKRDEQKVKKLIDELNFEQFKEIVYRRVADSIVWQMICGQHYVAAELYIPSKNESFSRLKHSNINHTIKEIERLNKNPTDFALMTDITYFVKVGDIILRTLEGVKLIELKQGIKNFEIKTLVRNSNETSNEDFIKFLQGRFDNNFVKQVQRMLNQSVKMQCVENVINLGMGINHQTNKPKYISNWGINQDNNFINKVVDLINKVYLTNEIMAYDTVECVHIGVYKRILSNNSYHHFQELIEYRTGECHPIYNLKNINKILEHPLASPLFIEHPLTIEQIINIVLGEIIIYISIDFNELFKMFKFMGVECKLLSRSETEKYQDSNTFKFKKCALVIKHRNFMSLLPIGVIDRIVFSNILPSEIVSAYLAPETISVNLNKDNKQLEVIEEISLNISPL